MGYCSDFWLQPRNKFCWWIRLVGTFFQLAVSNFRLRLSFSFFFCNSLGQIVLEIVPQYYTVANLFQVIISTSLLDRTRTFDEYFMTQSSESQIHRRNTRPKSTFPYWNPDLFADATVVPKDILISWFNCNARIRIVTPKTPVNKLSKSCKYFWGFTFRLMIAHLQLFIEENRLLWNDHLI